MKKLHRSVEDSMIGGVCGGLGAYFGIDATILRVLFTVATVIGIGAPVLVYVIMWIVIPEH